MSRQERYALLAALMKKLRDGGSWCGETHVQKAIYLAQELLQIPFGYNFRLYKHGPYSFDLADELASMRADDALRLRTKLYPYGPTLEPTERGSRLMTQCPGTVEDYDQHLAFIADWFGSKDVKQLERLATAFMVTREMPDGCVPQMRAERLHQLKPHISMPLAADAIKDADRLVAESERI